MRIGAHSLTLSLSLTLTHFLSLSLSLSLSLTLSLFSRLSLLFAFKEHIAPMTCPYFVNFACNYLAAKE